MNLLTDALKIYANWNLHLFLLIVVITLTHDTGGIWVNKKKLYIVFIDFFAICLACNIVVEAEECRYLNTDMNRAWYIKALDISKAKQFYFYSPFYRYFLL